MTDTALAPVPMNDDQQEAILRYLKLNPRDVATQALLLICERYGLDPLLKHVVLIDGRPYVTRDGLLHVAHADGRLDGVEVVSQDENETHFVAKVAVYRKDMTHAFAYVGRYPKGAPNAKKYGPEMAVKTAEVMALRRAFDISLAAREEMWGEENVGEGMVAGEIPARSAEGHETPSPANEDAAPVVTATASTSAPGGQAPPGETSVVDPLGGTPPADDTTEAGEGPSVLGEGAGGPGPASVETLWATLHTLHGTDARIIGHVNRVCKTKYRTADVAEITAEEMEYTIAAALEGKS